MNDMTDTSADQDEAVYKIGDLAEEFGVTLRTLRFYEDKGPAQANTGWRHAPLFKARQGQT
jgi:hypothetical protein